MQQSLYGNTTTSAPQSSLIRAEASRATRRLDQVGPSRTRLVSRHNPYATPSQGNLEGSTPKLRRRKQREGRSKTLNQLFLTTTADSAVATTSSTWEGASQDATHIWLPEPGRPPARASTMALRPPPTTPHLVAQDAPMDVFDLYSSFECEDNYGSNFFDSFDPGHSTSYQEQATVGCGEEDTLRATPPAAAPLPEPARPSAGKIKLSNLHHRLMRSKGCIPDIPLDRLEGAVRRKILRHTDLLVFKRQAQFREQQKWHGYREPEDIGQQKMPKKKVRFNPCSREGRNRKQRPIGSGVDELVYLVNRFKFSVSG